MSSLHEAVTQQLQYLTKLQQLLETELHLISSRDAEGLMNLLDDKQATLDAIQEQDASIESFYAQEVAEKGSIGAEIEALFEQAKQLIEQCKFRTSINQKAVEQGQLKLEHLRHLLLETRAKESLTYDRSGKPRGGTLGKGVSA
ncbi:flagellar export chaperone FlgN [Alteromonas oceanisediminis]|uniref:flagellar export chaperone FlgN n=1 Tax=Alteromonas oceanisediminis TaxID=2836180 RepID=UPI001BDB4F57|nr:flagellar export chaperone FlgN [Alteromonas oceanisediminis]MBT0584973.1 flagellar export chaperone FlgN [Alteromonas oceanisediminis]